MGTVDYRSWERIEKNISELPESPTNGEIPDKLALDDEIVLGRTRKSVIPKELWKNIHDPKIKENYAKTHYVSEYFSTCVYSLIASFKKPLAENMTANEKVVIKHVSSTRTTHSEEFRIENVIEGSIGSKAGPEGGAECSLSNKLTTEYSVKNLKEYYTEDSVETSREVNYGAKDYDREIVVWDFKKTIGLYRVYKKETVLIALDDFLYGSMLVTYKRIGKSYVLE
jgi:hypothetical protein